MKKNSCISMDEISKMMKTLGDENVEGAFSMAELSDKVGFSVVHTRTLLRKKIASGEVIFVGKQKRTAIDGRSYPVPLYKMVKGSK